MLEIIANVLEDRGDLGTKQDERANDDNRYQGDDQSVFDQSLTLAVMGYLQHFRATLSCLKNAFPNDTVQYIVVGH
ncbi:MAG: hypothetical protein ACXWQ5_22755, partial [Ktedonobacterales bacterium]